MTPLITRISDELKSAPGKFNFHLEASENTLYVPREVAQAVQGYSEGGNAAPIIKAIYFFPREMAGSLRWNVSEVQQAANDALKPLIDLNLVDRHLLPFWSAFYQQPEDPFVPAPML